MPRPLLPPNGIVTPTHLLYDKTLQPVVRDTWARLRGLAWGKTETPELSMEQICELLDMKRSTLYGHMLILKARVALQWRAVGSKTIIVSFPDVDEQSRNLDKPSLSVLTDSSSTKEGGTPVQKTGRKLRKPEIPKERPPAIDAFRAVSKRFPDEAVWPEIVQIVGSESKNLDRWQETIRGWIAAGYRKENIEGLLDWFKQGRTSKGNTPENGRRPPKPSVFKDFN